MNKLEVAKLLTLASGYDNRIVTEEVVIAWHELLSDVDYSLAVTAVKQYFKTSDKYLMPVHVITGVNQLRNINNGLPDWDRPAPEGRKWWNDDLD